MTHPCPATLPLTTTTILPSPPFFSSNSLHSCRLRCSGHRDDENRYNAGKGTHLNLKRAEKARVLVNKIPAMTETLTSKTVAWEEDKGTEFIYDGVRLTSMLEDYILSRQAKEHERRRQRIIFSVLKKFESQDCLWLNASAADVTLELKAPLLDCVYIIQDCRPLTCEPPCNIKFSDSRLKEFTYRGDGMSQAIVLSVPPSACHATFTITLWCNQETESCVSPLLKQFTQVKRIKFKFPEEPILDLLPKFAMLCYLELGFVSVEVLLGLIQKSPALNTLLFKGILQFNHELLNSAAVPNCLTSTLQVVKFGDVQGDKHELLNTRLILENQV